MISASIVVCSLKASNRSVRASTRSLGAPGFAGAAMLLIKPTPAAALAAACCAAARASARKRADSSCVRILVAVLSCNRLFNSLEVSLFTMERTKSCRGPELPENFLSVSLRLAERMENSKVFGRQGAICLT